MEKINIVLDFILIFAAIWMILTVRGAGLGGIVGKTLMLITLGAVVLGIAHLTETITFEVLQMEPVLVELIHRGIILTGFIFLTVGFKGLSKIGQAA